MPKIIDHVDAANDLDSSTCHQVTKGKDLTFTDNESSVAASSSSIVATSEPVHSNNIAQAELNHDGMGEVTQTSQQEQKDIIIIPKDEDAGLKADSFGNFSYCMHFLNNQGKQTKKEDTIVYLNGFNKVKGLLELSPQQVGERLWSTHKRIDDQLKSRNERTGSTASSNYYDGKGSIVTATLGDTSSFAVIFGKDRSVLKVVRLNSVTHNPTYGSREYSRIKTEGGDVLDGHIGKESENGDLQIYLNVSRSLGDNMSEFSRFIIPDSFIDITSLTELHDGIDPKFIDSTVLLVCSDGFTDAAGENQSIVGHENKLKQFLNDNETKKLWGKELCSKLTTLARIHGSKDDISIAMLPLGKEPGFIGVFDGHIGGAASQHIAENFGENFRLLCELTEEEYEASEYRKPNQRDHNFSLETRISNELEKFEEKKEEQLSYKDKVTKLLLNKLHDLFAENMTNVRCRVACEELLENIKTLHSLEEELPKFKENIEKMFIQIISSLCQLKGNDNLESELECMTNGFILLINSFIVNELVEATLKIGPAIIHEVKPGNEVILDNEIILELWEILSKDENFNYSKNFFDIARAYPEVLHDKLEKLFNELRQKIGQTELSTDLVNAGLHHLWGLGTEQDVELAHRAFNTAIHKNSSAGMFYKAMAFVSQNEIQTSFEYIRMAINKGNSDAVLYQAMMYRDQKKELFFQVLDDAINKGNSDAMLYKAKMLLAQNNINDGLKLLDDAINNGNSDAMLFKAVIYGDGKGVEKDITKSTTLLEQAIMKGNLNALFYMVEKEISHDVRKHFNPQTKILTNQAIVKSYSEALLTIAQMYMDGEKVEKNIPLAKIFLKQAIMKGNLDANYYMLCHSDKFNLDDDTAIAYALQMMKKHPKKVVYRLASLCFNGSSIAWYSLTDSMENYKKEATLSYMAIELFNQFIQSNKNKKSKNLKLNVANSYYSLAQMQKVGQGVPKNLTEAQRLLQEASSFFKKKNNKAAREFNRLTKIKQMGYAVTSGTTPCNQDKRLIILTHYFFQTYNEFCSKITVNDNAVSFQVSLSEEEYKQLAKRLHSIKIESNNLNDKNGKQKITIKNLSFNYIYNLIAEDCGIKEIRNDVSQVASNPHGFYAEKNEAASSSQTVYPSPR